MEINDDLVVILVNLAKSMQTEHLRGNQLDMGG